MEPFALWIIRLASVPPLALTVYTIFVYKRLSPELKTFALFIFLSGLIEAISKALWFYSLNNMPLLHVYVAVGFLLLGLFYKKVLEGFIDSMVMWIVIIGFLVFTTINSLFVQTIFTFNSYALTVESILIAIFSLSTYMLMLNDIVRKNRQHLVKSLNWINSGLFIYYASSLVIFFYSDLIEKAFSRIFNLQTWILHSFFSTVMYCCFFIGLWNRPRN